MTSLVSLLMIPIDCNYKFFLTLVRLPFLATIIIFGELTSATSKERMTTNISFIGLCAFLALRIIFTGPRKYKART